MSDTRQPTPQPQRPVVPPQRPVVQPKAEAVPPKTDEEIAELATRGLLFRSIEENTMARDQAYARMAAQVEANAEAEAASIEAARKTVMDRAGKD